jgi:hypothetical protein
MCKTSANGRKKQGVSDVRATPRLRIQMGVFVVLID